MFRHHGRVRAWHAGTATRSLATARTRHTLALTGTRGSTGTLSALRSMTTLPHSLAGCERIITGTRSASTATGTRTRAGTRTGRQSTGSTRSRARAGTRLRGLRWCARLRLRGRSMGLGSILAGFESRLGLRLRCGRLLLGGVTGRLHETRTWRRAGTRGRTATRLRATTGARARTRRRFRPRARLRPGGRLSRCGLLGSFFRRCLRLTSLRLRGFSVTDRFGGTDLVTQPPYNWCLNS
ncbi:hypothetical protein HMPREF9622_00498 [Cutibacterium modestum HL037PA3]|uniref:Uncharacterized protein n=1 Tax=Cutibacterium modestum HL044PA1 TaxID=765109 RepID=A0ABP2K9I2_9ACTN|nr:hypothetical protein HMPREF9621_01210 [Cutibacterium modestum HL037PA2]EFS93598.1 hypothetical protein HMPREF9607_00052 [Cutibacterium modestum HL044PA1]EFT16293.1 hypothetical protein HMPREF9622_00498 [Cutibacterium modestum HL037PA3]